MSGKYNKITLVTYPGGTVIHTAKYTYDFNKGQEEEQKYIRDSEKFKKVSLKVQSDISENKTLTDDTLKITLTVKDHAYTFISAAGFINVAFSKVIAGMEEAELEALNRAMFDREGTEFPRMLEFQTLINKVCKPEDFVKTAFKAHIKLHDSYTQEHIASIRYIINHLPGEIEEKDGEIILAADDDELKMAVTDLGMSTYFDIDIEE